MLDKEVSCGHCNQDIPGSRNKKWGIACPNPECIYKEEQFVLARKHEKAAIAIDNAWQQNRKLFWH